MNKNAELPYKWESSLILSYIILRDERENTGKI